MATILRLVSANLPNVLPRISRIGRRRRGRGLAGLGLEFAEAVEFVRLVEGRLVALALFREDVEQDRLVLRLQELEGPDEQRDVVAVDRAVVAEAELLEDDARQEQVLHAFLDLVRELQHALAADRLDKAAGLFVQVRVGRMGGDVVEVGRDGADVLGDRPLVVVEDDDEALGLRPNVVQRLVADAAGEGGIARDDDDVLVPASQVAPDGHAEGGGQGGAGVARAVAIVLAFGAEEEAVQALVLAHRVNALAPAGEHLVDVALVADVEDELVLRRVENAMQRDGQLDHAEVRPEMAAGLREHLDQFIAHFLRELREAFLRQGFDVGRRMDPSSKRVFSSAVLEEADIDIFWFSLGFGLGRGGRFKFFHDRFAGAVAGDDLNALLRRGEPFLANLDQLHSFLVAHDQVLKRKFAGFHLLHDLLEPFHGLFEVRFGSRLLRLVRHNGKGAIKHTDTN